MKEAAVKSLPIMFSYIFVSMAYGILMESAGLHWYYSLFVSMTALFVVIFLDQWESARSHVPALVGIVTSVVCLFIVGVDYFLLPALIISSGILLVWNAKRQLE